MLHIYITNHYILQNFKNLAIKFRYLANFPKLNPFLQSRSIKSSSLTLRSCRICSRSSRRCSIFLLIVNPGSAAPYSWRDERLKAIKTEISQLMTRLIGRLNQRWEKRHDKKEAVQNYIKQYYLLMHSKYFYRL